MHHSFCHDLFRKAEAKLFRRRQLWHAARQRVGDAAFYENLTAVERAIGQTLAEEFPPTNPINERQY